MSKEKLNREYENVLKALGWEYSYHEKNVEISNYSPIGENLVELFSTKYFVEDVQDLYNDFDVDQHVAGLIIAKSQGLSDVPNSITDLLKDAKAIEGMYKELADRITAASEKQKKTIGQIVSDTSVIVVHKVICREEVGSFEEASYDLTAFEKYSDAVEFIKNEFMKYYDEKDASDCSNDTEIDVAKSDIETGAYRGDHWKIFCVPVNKDTKDPKSETIFYQSPGSKLF